MEEQNDIFSKLIKRPKPAVPEQFFKTFSQDLSARLNDLEDEAGLELIPQNRLGVPPNFFAGFYDNLKAEIDAENALKDLGIAKRKRPTVPENFEATFHKELIKKIKPASSRGRILKITFWSTAAAVAAGLTLLLTLNTEKPAAENAVATTQPAVMPDDESLDTYVAYLDEESVVDYIIEYDINVGESETADEAYDYMDNDIEEIYMDL